MAKEITVVVDIVAFVVFILKLIEVAKLDKELEESATRLNEWKKELEEVEERLRVLEERKRIAVEEESRARHNGDSAFQDLLRYDHLTVEGEEEARMAVHVYQRGYRGRIYSADVDADRILGECSVPHFPAAMCERIMEEEEEPEPEPEPEPEE